MIKLLIDNNSPEIEVLFYGARPYLDTKIRERLIFLLQKDLDWQYLLKIAHAHGVMPLLFSNLNTVGIIERIPLNIQQQLRENFSKNAQRSLFLTAELLRLLNLFTAESIPILPFKGPVLAATAYGNFSQRQFCDLDILVQETDILKAKKLLLSQGYEMKIEHIKLTPAQETTFILSSQIHQFIRECAYPFVCHKKGIMIELHWRLMPKYFAFPLDSATLWDNLTQITISGKIIPTLSPEDSIIMLCGHGTKDCWLQLARICDLAALIHHHPQLNWQKLLEKSQVFGIERILLLGLCLTEHFLGTNLPENIRVKMQADSMIASLSIQVRSQLFQSHNISVKQGKKTLFHLQTRERIQDKINYFLQLAITPTTSDWLLLPLSEFPAFIYYLLRPIRLIFNQLFAKLLV